ALSQPLGQGHHTYTATATQTDEAGNTASAGPTPPFVVDTQAPTVTLDPPRSPTNNTTPSFSGIASERTTVTIRIYNAGSGQLAAQTSAAGTGSSWTSGAATPALADGRYWVVASQESAFGNHAGETERTPLTVDTVSPHVTLEPPSSGSGTSEQVRGSADASDPDGDPTVTVQLYAGSAIAGSPMQSLTVPVSGGVWSATIGGLGAGTYTVRAERSDAAGNVAFSPSG